VKPVSIDNKTDFQHIVVTVSGAGVIELNGEKKKKKILDEAASFEKASMYDGKLTVFCLYRCRMNDNTHNWYISIPPKDSDPGTGADIDFYTAPSQYDRLYPLDDRLPPKTTWSKCRGSSGPVACPTISWTYECLSPSGSDDRDDMIAVAGDEVNDDSFSSMISTPVGDGDIEIDGESPPINDDHRYGLL
jgi:hypothetical protein